MNMFESCVSACRPVVLTAFCGVAALTAAADSFTIVGPEAAKPYEQTAAEDLRDYLGRCVKDTLTVEGQGDVVFHVGDTDFARAHGLSSAVLKDEEWVVRSFGRDVVLNGGGTRGALYAVSHFLEDCCGVRWWSQIETDVPEARPLAFGKLDLRGRPAFAMRAIYQALREKGADRLAVHQRQNGSCSVGYGNTLALGGAFRYGSPGDCHTFAKYIPEKTYFKDHPEWFGYSKKKQKRVGGVLGQLCLTNPELRQEMKRRLRAFIETDRARADGMPPPTLYDVSQNDNESYCQCEACEAAKTKWGLGGLTVDFVNEIASAVKDDYPDVLVQTFAYQGSEAPPKGGVRAADNVAVRLCNTRSNQAAPMWETGNTEFFSRLSAWSRAAKRLLVWDYSINFTRDLTGLPFPSEVRYGDFYHECRVHGVWGFFVEHESQFKSDFFELKLFLETKLMEDPSLDAEALTARFMREYYGPAGEKIAKYRRDLDKLRTAKKGVIRWFPALKDWDWFDPEHVASAQRLFDAAEAATDGREPYLSRVKRARVGLDRLLCQRIVSRGGDRTPEFKAAEARLRSFWPKWMARYRTLEQSKVLDELASSVGLPPPRKFEGRAIFDYPAPVLVAMDECEHGDMKLVDDPDSETGRALRIVTDSNPNHDLPYAPGLWNEKTRKALLKPRFAKPLAEKGYAWYPLGTAEVPEHGYVWLTGTWATQLRLRDKPHLIGKTFEFWVSVKFTGRKYVPGSTDESCLWIDRVVLVPVPAKEGE